MSESCLRALNNKRNRCDAEYGRGEGQDRRSRTETYSLSMASARPSLNGSTVRVSMLSRRRSAHWAVQNARAAVDCQCETQLSGSQHGPCPKEDITGGRCAQHLLGGTRAPHVRALSRLLPDRLARCRKGVLKALRRMHHRKACMGCPISCHSETRAASL